MASNDAQQWLAAWRTAGPLLEQLRDESLRNLDEETGTRQATLLGIPVNLIPSRSSTIDRWAALAIKWRQQTLDLKGNP